MQRGQQDQQSKQQLTFGEVLLLGSDSGISNLIRYSKLEEMCLRDKKKEKPVFFFYYYFFKRDSWTFKVQYFTSESTQQQHNNTLDTPIHYNGHTFG